jgi:creatinine amidohydrolase
MSQKVLYEELTPEEFQQRLVKAPIAYLPLGTLEWHGPHLPLGADGIQAQGFFKQLAERAGGIVLPVIFMGPDTLQIADGREYYGMDFECAPDSKPVQLTGSAYWITEKDFMVVVGNVLKQLKRAGFRIVMAHGHGPSVDFFSKHRQIWKKEYGLNTFTCELADEETANGIQTDHAGANETSLVLSLRPDLVQLDKLPTDLDIWPLAVEGEDPRTDASAERGKKCIAFNLERFSQILSNALSELELD